MYLKSAAGLLTAPTLNARLRRKTGTNLMIGRLYRVAPPSRRLSRCRASSPAVFICLSAEQVYTASVYLATIYGGAYASEPGQDLARRFGWRRGLDNLEFSCRKVRHHR